MLEVVIGIVKEDGEERKKNDLPAARANPDGRPSHNVAECAISRVLG